jgi:hypothetical protein
MAITRTQQARQMYNKGSKKPVKQAGATNYLGKQEMVTAPKFWLSEPDHVKAKLAYITDEEEQILIDKNLYGSLKGKPNIGPAGLPSLQGGDFGSEDKGTGGGGGGGGGGNGGEDRRESYIRDYSSKGIVKGGGKKTTTKPGEGPQYEDSRPTKAVIDRQKARYNKQFFDKGLMPPLGSRPTDFKTKLNQRRNQNILNFINRNLGKDLYRSGFIGPNIDKRFLGGAVPTTGSILGELMASYNPDLLENEINLFDEDSVREIASVLSKTKTGITPVQESALESFRQNIKNREELKEQGMTQDRFEELYPGPPKPKDDSDPEDPCLGPNPPAYCFIGQRATTTPEDPVFTPAFRFMNRGGMVEDAPMGGIMDLETTRQMLFIGGVAKAIGKGVKSVTRGLKKVAKSPLGKAALLGAVGFGVPGTGFGGLFGRASFGGKAAGLFRGYGLKGSLQNIAAKTGLGMFENVGGNRIFQMKNLGDIFGNMSGLKVAALSGLGGALLANVGKEDDDGFDIEEYYRMAGIDIPENQYRFLAEGGSTEKEPVAKKTMPLLDLEGQEMDFRQDGGFVPIGRMEKADDVPARLSKNEFVFTAEAVRNAGGGDVDKGAEVMYNTMKNLEAGGEVSEETQGLEGARNMFQTAQRLGEVV